MAFFKKKLHVGAAMRKMLGAALSRDPQLNLAEIATSGILQPVDLVRIGQELLPFDLALWHVLFLDYFEVQAEELFKELTEKFSISLTFALKDKGVADSDLKSRTEQLINIALEYFDAFSSASPQEMERGIYFSYCKLFTRRVLPGLNIHSEADNNRYFQIFDIAKQNCEVTQQTFEELLRKYKLTNE